MKTALVVLSLFFFQASQSQLVSLETYKHSFTEAKGPIYKQFNFRIDAVDGHQVIKAIKTDKVLYDPQQPVFYEVFANSFLIATLIDTGKVKTDTLTINYLLPRTTLFAIPLTGSNRFKKMYSTNLDNTIVVPDAKTKKAKGLHWYKMRNIETVNKKVLLYDRKEMVHQFWFTEILL